MHVGFVGTGSMGSILIDALISSRALLPNQIIASNRTPSKAASLAKRHPGLTIAENNAGLAEKAEVIFLCVKPLEYQNALSQFADRLTGRHLLVTITSPVRLAELEDLVPCPVVRVIPSITNAACSGLTLVEFGSRVTADIRQTILTLMSHISCPLEIEEPFLRIASDISSCGPAFLSYLLQEMIRSAQEKTGISGEAATFLATQMVIGFAELLKQEIFSLPSLQERVCVPGGITGEGLAALKQGVPGLFNEVFKRTHAKFAADRHEMSQHLSGLSKLEP